MAELFWLKTERPGAHHGGLERKQKYVNPSTFFLNFGFLLGREIQDGHAVLKSFFGCEFEGHMYPQVGGFLVDGTLPTELIDQQQLCQSRLPGHSQKRFGSLDSKKSRDHQSFFAFPVPPSFVGVILKSCVQVYRSI